MHKNPLLSRLAKKSDTANPDPDRDRGRRVFYVFANEVVTPFVTPSLLLSFSCLLGKYP